VLASGKDRNSASKIRDSNCNSILMNNNTLNIGVIKLFHSGGDMQSHIQALEGHSCEKAGVARSWCGEQPRGPCAAMPTHNQPWQQHGSYPYNLTFFRHLDYLTSF
jgi:uncharacterized protein YqkB